MAVGGVNETNVSQFLKAGFAGAAAGSNLVPRKSTDGNLELIRQKARLYVQAMERRHKAMAFIVQNMTWPMVKERLEVCSTAIVPIGSTEQHGYHLLWEPTSSWRNIWRGSYPTAPGRWYFQHSISAIPGYGATGSAPYPSLRTICSLY